MPGQRGPRVSSAPVALRRAISEGLPRYLSRQLWFAERRPDASPAPPPSTVGVIEVGTIREERPSLYWVVVDADSTRYQVLLGVRSPADVARLLRGRERAMLGPVEDAEGPGVAYDALTDPELALEFESSITGEAPTTRSSRRIGPGTSNTTLLCEDRFVLKLFHRVPDGPNPDVEIPFGLDAAGFNHQPAPVAHWHRDLPVAGGGHQRADLAVLREYYRGGVEGWALALTSVRDFFSLGGIPEAAGGDFGDEAGRLGAMTARLHCALASSFGQEAGRPAEWADEVARRLAAVPSVSESATEDLVESLRGVTDAGLSIRVHGDYHLGRVMRTEVGWYVLDFEGDPRISLSERRRLRSPLEDVAGLLQSLEYATGVAARERGPAERAERSDLPSLALAWNRRNRDAFLDGYLTTPGVEALLPRDAATVDLLLDAFEVARAAANMVDEIEHRPWREATYRRALAPLLA
jgi:maltokinase